MNASPILRPAALAALLLLALPGSSQRGLSQKGLGAFDTGLGKKTPAKKNPPKRRDLSKGNTLFVVPYAHLDTQWRWAYPQVIREFIANTLTRNFALFEQYPHYVFNFSGSRRYEMMKEYFPADYERLKGYIKAGRWFPCGSSVDENDANVPSGESLIRHVLYGNRFFRREFGVASHEYMLPDCFGFPYALPSILVHCGIQGFSTQKLTWGSAVGIPFKVGTWEGPDGRSIVAALDPGSYGGGVDEDLSLNTSWLARIQDTGKKSGAYVDYHYYGTGDTGGAPQAKAVDWMEKSIAGKGPITVVSAHSDEMFTDLTPEQIAGLPHYKGELLLTAHSAGSISSQAMMKRWNRKNELLADAAERASVGAMMLGVPYPSKRLYDAWDLVLGSQMHDMLPGTSIPKAYEFCWNDELLAQNQFAAVETDAVGTIASAMDTRPLKPETHRYGPLALVVYNPLSIARSDVVEAKIPDYTEPLVPVEVYDRDGRPVPTQTLDADSEGTYILFKATAPPCGFAVFHVQRSGPQVRTTLHADGHTIENERFSVAINKDGDIASIFDKMSKREVLKAPARLDFQYENPTQFPAWNMDWEDQKKPPYDHVHGPAKISVIEHGPVRVALRVERETNGSKFIQEIRLTAGGDRVEVLNKIDWQTKETALKASFPLAAGNPEATYDLQLGAIKRGNNNEKKYEVPQHQWLDLTKPDGSYGVGLLNDSKYGSDKPDDNTVRLTMIYTPGVKGGYSDQSTQDFGRHEILFALQPHAGDWRRGDVPWGAKRLNQPLRAFIVPSHPGKLGKSFSLLSTNSKQVEVQAVKKAEDSNEIIVRLRELTGQPARGVHLQLGGGIASAREMNGQEFPIGPATVRNGEIVTDVPAFSLKTFAIRTKPLNASAGTLISIPVKLPFDADVASLDKSPADGDFDGHGRTIAAEQLPAKVTIDGIDFYPGPTKDGAKNAVTARGQTIGFPKGYGRLYVLAATCAGDVRAGFRIGGRMQFANIQDWSGYVGQWDNRLWASDPGPNFTNYGEMAGLEPGYVRTGEVAWFASHRHTPAGNTFYEYTYLCKYGFDIPAGATSLTLPKLPQVKILAVTVSRNDHDRAIPAFPLSDRLTDHVGGGPPSITPSGGTFNDVTAVTIQPPLYWRGGGLHYTLDETAPTAASPIYRTPLSLNDPTTIKAVEIDASGNASPIVTARLDVHDTTPPRVVSATSPKVLGLARVRFSERVSASSAQDPANYRFSSGASVASAKLSQDGRAVELTLDRPLPVGNTETVTVSGVRDLAKIGNTLQEQAVEVAEKGAVFTSGPLEPKTAKAFNNVPDLPVKAHDAWTVNLFCKIDAQPEDRTIIAGFGRSVDGRTGTGRYFTKFPGGINFWASNCDVMTRTPLDIGKWQMLTATYDGATMRLYKNGEKIAEEAVELANDQAQVRVMPLDAWERQRRFMGEVRDFTIWDLDLSPEAIQRLWIAGR